MGAKHIQLVLVISVLNSCLTSKAQPADIDVNSIETNSHWHIVTSDPDRFIPPHVPAQVVRLKNGRWAWTTNVEEWWQGGVWREDTNGWRTLLSLQRSWLTVEVGSTVKDADGCFITPNGKFAKFELRDGNGNAVPIKKNAGTNLLAFLFLNPSFSYPTHLPKWAAPLAGSLVANFPETTTTNVLPRWNGAADTPSPCSFGFVSNGPPRQIAQLNLEDAFSITNAGDYTLTVQPVIYSRHIAHVTLTREQLVKLLKEGVDVSYYGWDDIFYAETNLNNSILYRRVFPTVTTKVHLIPNGL